MQIVVRMLVGSTTFALALIGSSWLLKGNPAGDWVDAVLYIALGCFFVSQTASAFPQIFAPQRRGS